MTSPSIFTEVRCYIHQDNYRHVQSSSDGRIESYSLEHIIRARMQNDSRRRAVRQERRELRNRAVSSPVEGSQTFRGRMGLGSLIEHPTFPFSDSQYSAVTISDLMRPFHTAEARDHRGGGSLNGTSTNGGLLNGRNGIPHLRALSGGGSSSGSLAIPNGVLTNSDIPRAISNGEHTNGDVSPGPGLSSATIAGPPHLTLDSRLQAPFSSSQLRVVEHRLLEPPDLNNIRLTQRTAADSSILRLDIDIEALEGQLMVLRHQRERVEEYRNTFY